MEKINFRLAGKEDALIRLAEELAARCRYFATQFHYSQAAINMLHHISEREGVLLPDKDEIGRIKRLCDKNWWVRNLRVKHRIGLEEAAIRLNLVNKRRGAYISDENLACHRVQKARNSALLKSVKAINELGQEFTLEELAEKSTSNPAIRRSELMVRIAGMEVYAKAIGHAAAFITLTCPSRMHASLSRSGRLNPNYDNTTPKEAHDFLNQQWKKIRAKLNRQGTRIYGVRVVEPHHDGTPHWHFLLFMERELINPVFQIIRDYALEDCPEEPGAQAKRATLIHIDWAKGSAAGYVAKYVSKNIDGFGVDKDQYGNDAAKSSERVNAWASTWRIRQFQFIGGPQVSIWRELRRLSPEHLHPGLVRECSLASDENDWCNYMQLMGGHNIRRSDSPLKLLKIWSDALGKYGEPLGYIIKGIEFDGLSYISRIHTWKVESTRKPFRKDEKLLTIGNRRMVHEVERPLLGEALEGMPAETMRLGPLCQ